jgi:hypothetical protein
MAVTLTPVEGNPFQQQEGNVTLTPVEGNPFAEQPRPAPTLAPVPDTPDNTELVQRSYLGRIMDAFKSGAAEGYGTEPYGLSDADKKWLNEHTSGIANSFVNGVMVPAADYLDSLLARTPNSIYHAIGDAAIAAGVPRDFVAMPEAFLGSPVHLNVLAGRGEIFHAEPREVPIAAPSVNDLPPDLPLTEQGIHPAEAVRDPLTPHPETTATLATARELGVIGPEPKPITEGTPAEAAANAVNPQRPTVMAASRSDETIQSAPINPAVDKAGNIRLDLIETSDDAKNVIREAAAANDDFMPARHGDIPLSQVEALSQVTGIAPEDLDVTGIGRRLQNDGTVRSYIQALIQSAEGVSAKMKAAALSDTPEDLMALQEARMRHSLIQEQVAGLTAEWGRTGNVFQEFRDQVKDANSLNDFLKSRKGESLDDLRNLARAGSELDPRTQLPAFLNASRKPGFWDKAIWYWVNALISGPITHLKYIEANAAFAGYDAAVVTPLAGMLGASRKVLPGVESEGRVLMGETAARLWGLVAGTPDAVVAAYKAARSGLQTPLPGEIAQGLIPKQNRTIAFQQKPIPGALGTLVGLPSRGASAIHSFFNFLGYRAALEQQAYREAARGGLSPTSDAFWQKRSQIVASPSAEMMNKAIEEGYRLTYITELGPAGKKVAAAINSYPPFKLVIPFVHIPFNILKQAANNTALAVFDKGMREDLLGRNGVAAQDTALARVVAGSAIGAWAINGVMNDRITGAGPADPKERALWLLTHQPYSIRIGDQWVSYSRFGALGTLLGLHANLADALPHMKWDGDEATKAAALLVRSTGRLVEDEVGMQGLAGLLDAINEPERKGARFMSAFAGSWLPYSSALRQAAAYMDPDMREAKNFIDGLRYNIPVAHEGLLPRRDWTGNVIPNPAYHSVLRGGNAVADPINLEMQALNIWPTLPRNRIGGVKLTPQQYDEYQAHAGPLTHTMLEHMVGAPGWKSMPPFIRETMIRSMIKSTRAQAAAYMQMRHPELITQGIRQKVERVTGRPVGSAVH